LKSIKKLKRKNKEKSANAKKKVIIDKVGEVKLVVFKRKKDGTTKYIISTNESLHRKKSSQFARTDGI